MNRRDDGAENCLHTGFSDRVEYPCVFPRVENTVCGQESSEGASAFMNNPGYEPASLRLLDSFDEFPELFDELVDQRNQAWDRQLTEILRHGVKDYMVIVGALHLLGERGVIELLRQRGFEVRRL